MAALLAPDARASSTAPSIPASTRSAATLKTSFCRRVALLTPSLSLAVSACCNRVARNGAAQSRVIMPVKRRSISLFDDVMKPALGLKLRGSVAGLT